MGNGDQDDAILNDMLGELEGEPPANQMLVTDDLSTTDPPEEVEVMQTEEIEEPESSNVGEEVVSKDRAPRSKVTEFPLSKIKGIMKMDPEVVMIGSEAVFAAAKAAELFVQTLAKQAYKHTQSQKKKVIQRSHVDAAIAGSESLFFLEDALD